MSMWEFEALAEMSVAMIAESDLTLGEKRNAYANAYALVSVFDVSFVHFRSVDALVAASFFHRIDIEQHPDYAAHKAYFDGIVEAGESEWIHVPGGPDAYGGDEGFYEPEPHRKEIEPGLWFDSTSGLWRRAVDAGLLTGLAAEPIELWPNKEIIVRFMVLAAQQGEKQYGLLKMLHGMAVYAFMMSDEMPEPGDEILASARELPALKAALAAKHEDWIDERFDARMQIGMAINETKVFLEWWCAPYPDRG